MRLGLRIGSVEICIRQCRSVGLSGCGCAITAVHRQMTLRRHVSRKCDTHRLELREAIGDRQCRWGIKRLVICYALLAAVLVRRAGCYRYSPVDEAFWCCCMSRPHDRQRCLLRPRCC